MYDLRLYQSNDVTNIRQAFADYFRAPLYVLPTGGGKTVVFTHIAEGVIAKQNRALILVHRQELLKQTSKALQKQGILHGIINPKFRSNPLAQIQVGSVQTVVKRLHKINKDFDLIVIDEAHHAAAESWAKIVAAIPAAKILGVTATPVRSDGKGLGKHVGGLFDKLIQGPQIAELIAEGYLKVPKVFGSREILDLTDVKTIRGDYEKSQLEKKINQNFVTGDAVKEYSRICPGLPAVVFCVSIRHAEEVAQKFVEAGWAAASIDGNMSDSERSARLEGLEDGSLQILTSCDLIGEGIDIPAVSACICLRPTKSLGLWLQMTGRALRPYEGQEIAYILDHAGNSLRHGLPDEDRTWSLDGDFYQRKKGDRKSPHVMSCKNCGAVTRYADDCSECGSAQLHGARVINERGELAEISAGDLDRLKEEGPKVEPKPVRSLEDFAAEAKERGYKLGWAYHRYNAQFKQKTA